MITSILTPEQKSFWQSKKTVKRDWYHVDIKDVVLGRASTKIAQILMGKHKPTYTSSVDCGDFVVVTNVAKVKLTGNKILQKVSFHHTFHPGGARIIPYKKLMEEKPERALFLSVKRMLPKNRISSRQILRLKIYKEGVHPHQAQTLKKVELN